MKKQFIAKLLALALVLSMVPVAILGASAETGTNAGSGNAGSGNTGSGSTSGSSDTTVVGGGASSSTTTVDAADVTVKDGTAVIEAKVVNGTANVVLTEKAVEALAEQVEGDELVLKIEAKDATKVDVSIPAKALSAMGEKTGAALAIESPIVTITIPNEALATVFGNAGTVKISAQASGSSVGFSIQLSGKSLKNIKGLKVEF